VGNQTAKYEEGRATKHVKFSPNIKHGETPTAKKDEKHPSKLQLASAVKQSLVLVTQCSMTPTEAGTLFKNAFNRALDLN
jgi:hypothetical protein